MVNMLVLGDEIEAIWDHTGDRLLNYNVLLIDSRKGYKEHDFVDLPSEINDILLSKDFFKTNHIGQVCYKITLDNILSCRWYEPFGIEPFTKPTKIFLGKGIADKIELLIINNLIDKLGNNIKLSIGNVSDEREEQLKRYGCVPNSVYDIIDFKQRIQKAILSTNT